VTSTVIGFGMGLGVGLFGFFAIRRLADRIATARPDAAGQRTASLIRSTAIVDLVLFTAAGTLVGWYVFPSG
jgi:hypothetical protein